MGKFSRLGNALYSGQRSIDFVGKTKVWYALSGAILIVALGGLFGRGLELGLEFVGGSEYNVSIPKERINQDLADQLREAVAGTGIPDAAAPEVTTADESIRIQVKSLTPEESAQVTDAIQQSADVPGEEISQTDVGPSWGKEVAKKSLIGLGVFLLSVILFIWAYFREWKMSVAAIVALIHDIVITVGIYALTGFEVTPATVTGFLTILGFSLYDTVVVFDKVRENTKAMKRSHRTYAEAANLAINQTLVRSINTSIVALIPVGAILYVSVTQLGSGSLKDLALALFVGMAAGAYSSIFIATPLLAHMKGAEQGIQLSDRRAKARQRHDADRYASVPAFAEDMPIYDEPSATGEADLVDEERAPEAAPVVRGTAPLISGRVAPPSRGDVKPSASANRAQPARQPRSKRGKK